MDHKDLIEMEPKGQNIQKSVPVKEHMNCNLSGRKLCIAFSIVIIITVWLVVLVPLILVLVNIISTNDGGSQFTGEYNLSSILPPINSTNYTNFTILQVECIEGFVYVAGEEICYPVCEWSPYGEGVTTKVRIALWVLNVLGILLGIATLVVWLLTSCVDWKKLRIHYDFQLARTSLFMVVICSLMVIISNACVDFIDYDALFCFRTDEGVSYLMAQIGVRLNLESTLQTIINILGFVNSYFYLVNLWWIALSIINILVIVFFPYLRKRLRNRIFCFSSQCFLNFGLNLIPMVAILILDPVTTFVPAFFTQFILIFNKWLFIILFFFPSVLLPSFVISLVVIVVAKLRINSFKSLEVTGKQIKLTSLEKRLIWYSILIVVILFLYGIVINLISYLSTAYFANIVDYTLCVTINSPIITLPNVGTLNSTVNDTITVYRDNPYGDLDVCQDFADAAFMKFPYFLSILLIFYSRVIFLPIFIVLVPHISIRSVMKLFKSKLQQISSR
ncbi:hypothetical protein LOD99_14034 [Oopsacas minuta]|uniref:G-protein coupled receptors family 1 profile domain-containing protein n=1 Tax=Oopsacas minuta TaxID=111878 RepID=A0AAV7KGM7_9METZ|nr:hypothetical protein LOD99_14034 [Oopsacas minuta]